MRAGTNAGERPARPWQSQESVRPDSTPSARAAQARKGASGLAGLVDIFEKWIGRPRISAARRATIGGVAIIKVGAATETEMKEESKA
jgi:hypothetical protein